MSEAPLKIKYRRDLWRLIQHVSGDIAEIGVAEGRFSEEILAWPLSLVDRVYLVDAWTQLDQPGDGSMPQEWHERNHARVKAIAEKDSRVTMLRGRSTFMVHHVLNKSLALCYIDADHSYDGVMADILAWWPKVALGGVMAFHDYQNPAYGVKEAVQDYFGKIVTRVIYDLPEDKPEDAGAFVIC